MVHDCAVLNLSPKRRDQKDRRKDEWEKKGKKKTNHLSPIRPRKPTPPPPVCTCRFRPPPFQPPPFPGILGDRFNRLALCIQQEGQIMYSPVWLLVSNQTGCSLLPAFFFFFVGPSKQTSARTVSPRCRGDAHVCGRAVCLSAGQSGKRRWCRRCLFICRRVRKETDRRRAKE